MHLSYQHWLLDGIAMLALPFIFPLLRFRWAVFFLSIAAPLLTGCLYVTQPDWTIYAGLSGLLHGLYLWAALLTWHSIWSANTLKRVTAFKATLRQEPVAALVIVGIMIKLIYEAVAGSPNTDLGFEIGTAAHAWGALLGGLAFIMQRLVSRR